MIEIVQQTEKNTEGKLPKNIRQIGNPEKDFRIYMEDYVYTYLHPAQIYAMPDGQGTMAYGAREEIFPRLLVLVGEINHFSNRSCAFICGAIQVEDGAFSEDVPKLTDDALRQVHKELQQFFGKSEVVGWVLDIPGNNLVITPEMEAVHRNHFISPYQFFFLMDSKEREEAFYVWKGGHLTRKEGYFIYYEKNPGMQEYIISKREMAYGEASPTEEMEDRAAKNYRAVMLRKKEQESKRETGILSYLMSMLMVVVLCTVSVMLLGNIRRMEDMEKTISVMSMAMETTEQEKENTANQVSVETVKGNIQPIEEDKEDAAAPAEDPREDAAAALARLNDAEELQEDIQPPEESFELPQEEVQPETSDDAGVDMPQNEQPLQEAPPVQTEAEQYRAQGYYIVQQGDSLRQICYNIYQTYTMLGMLCEANAIEDEDYIYIGQKIILP